MSELYLLRHADAGNPDAWQRDDAERPLSKKGRAQAERMGAWLARLAFEPDAVVSSPKVRARETAELAAEPLAAKVKVSLDERLASGFGLPELAALLAELGWAKRVVLVGHDPDFSELLSELVASPTISMRKGALARIDLPDDEPPGPGVGQLRWLVPPDALPER